ncbi:DUF445 domain-containing protein [Microvirga sp. VF16]|uniref:DUF445 domain-containing protein n=1 Tax=Microvirga sp. VF16 TaxID=2807101 RepID=UPI00193E33E7|nr:DUF445 domain-containing protein [Microvirga sp. VF16]QRM32540.1 DUF445 domain-containing protein [Microvirga sp. VF16]
MQLDKPPRSTALSRLGYEPDDGSHEENARQRLRRNRNLATGLLLGMGATYVATHLVREPGFGTLLVRSGAEAGIVGGLADWFAVTALFRYPLGLRIPHTAIIPNNKDRIGRTLGRFVERHFLTEEILLAKLRKAHAGQRIAEWLAAPQTAPLIADTIIAAIPHLIRTLESHDIHDFANRTLGEQLRQADLAPIIGRAIEMTTTSGEADVLFERAIGIAVGWLEDNRSQIDDLVRERSRWWIPKAIDRRIAAAIVSGIMDLLQGLAQPDSDVRLKFRDALAGLIDELLNSPEQREQLNASKNRILNHPDVQAWIASVWGELSQTMLDDLAQPSSKMRSALEQGLHLVGRTLASDHVMQRHIDEALERLAAYLTTWRGEIGGFIAEVVRTWDTRTLTDRLELVVGSDLQYIRMNGTVVGACAGCLIFLLTSLFT